MDIKLPKLGEGADSGTVAGILVKVGDMVAEGQTIMELENEKAVAPIPASAGGRVRAIRVKQGDKIAAGHVILTLEGSGAEAAAADQAVKEPRRTEHAPPLVEERTPAAVPAMTEGFAQGLDVESQAPAESADRPPPAAAPSIRRIAAELGIDLTRVRGSERGGRIIMADLRAYIQRLQKLASQPPAPTPAAAAPTGPAAQGPRIDFAQWGPVSRKPTSTLRQTISRRMTENWNTIPHVTQFHEADITALNELRKKYAPVYEQRGVKLTLTSFVLKAVAAILKQHPIFNCSLDEATQELVFKDYYHLGLAVDTEHGLIVPVIRDVDQKDLVTISKDVSELADKARQRKVSLEELRGGTFTLSNQGGIGGGHFTPIINKPEVAILGLGRSAPKAAVTNGRVEPRWLMPMALSYDHRVIDGASAARFIVDLATALEQFREETVRI